MTIGILGGVASGKSFVAGQLEQLGALRIDADRIAHAVLETAQVRAEIVDRWGSSVLNAEGEVDRPALAAKVFQGGLVGAGELAILEKITHPRIEARMREQLAAGQQKGIPAAVLDAAVLVKAGWNRLCDTILYVEVPRQQRLERAQARGWSEDEFAAREAAQESLDVKRNAADWEIDNAGTPAATLAQVQEFWQTLHIDPPASQNH